MIIKLLRKTILAVIVSFLLLFIALFQLIVFSIWALQKRDQAIDLISEGRMDCSY